MRRYKSIISWIIAAAILLSTAAMAVEQPPESGSEIPGETIQQGTDGPTVPGGDTDPEADADKADADQQQDDLEGTQVPGGAVPPEDPAAGEQPDVEGDEIDPSLDVGGEVEAEPVFEDVARYSGSSIGPVGQYTTWNSATVLTPGETAEFTLNQYDNDDSASQMWFAMTVTDNDQAIEMTFDAADDMYVYLYDEATLAGQGPASGNRLGSIGYFDGERTYSWKTDHAGVYYLLLRARSASYKTETASTLTVALLDGDNNENNDSWEDAYELAQNVSVYYNLSGQNDEDWFEITTTVPGEAIRLVFFGFDYTVPRISAYLYDEAELASGGNSFTALDSMTNFSGDSTLTYKVDEPGTYYVRIKPYSSTGYVTKDLRLRYEIVPPDDNELNDSYTAATQLPDSYDMPFTLNGKNDEDWFYFETESPNELVYLYFSGFETDYSNQITYYVYDAVDGGNPSQKTWKDINITHSTQMTFANTGGHYIRVKVDGSVPVENTLKLRIERGSSDSAEPNDNWQEATPIFENSPLSFNIPSDTDVDYFVLSVDEPNQTLEVTLWIPSGGSVWYHLYSGEDYQQDGNSANSIDSSSSGSGTGKKVYRHMLDEIGDYYIRLTNASGGIFDENATITYRLISPDKNERNNTWKTASVLNEGIATEFNIPAENDEDYFKVTTSEPNQTLEVTLQIPDGGSVWYHLFSGNDYNEDGDNANSIDSNSSGSGSGTKVYRHMLDEVGDYYIRIMDASGGIFDESAMITYNLIPPDENERNNTWKTATVLNEGIAAEFNIPAENDEDYFKVTTSEPNQTLEVTLQIPSGGSVWYHLFSGNDYNEDGDNANSIDSNSSGSGSGTKVYRHMLDEVGDYYIRIMDASGGIFDESATITYRLIPPDDNERNNTFGTATMLHVQTPAYYTIPADNDQDWFKLDAVTVGDKITATFGGDNGGTRYSCILYCVKTGETSVTSLGTKDITKNADKYTWTANYEGDYYLRLSTSHSIDSTLRLSYVITRDDVDVTGVTIGNGDSTIVVGQTLQLYANIQPSNAADQSVTWQSSDPDVASIDGNGLVTAHATGQTTITVQTNDKGYTATTRITVADPVRVTGVSLSCGDPQPVGTQGSPKALAQGTSLQLTASIQPENATNRGLTWSVSDPEVLQVTDYGKVYAAGSGSAKVTVTTADGKYTADFWINVPDEDYPVRGVSLNYNAATIYMGEAGVKLEAAVSPSYATNPSVTWSSDNEAVARVDQNGQVTPVSEGYATITVTAQENSAMRATCRISVQSQRTRVTGISFAQATMDVGLYGTITLQPVIAPADATDQTVSWTSSNTTVATVSRTGVVTALNIGQATITATTQDGGFEAEITIYVSSTASVGDINNDGVPDSGDALMVLRYSVGLLALSEAQKSVADVNGDGRIDAGDAILLLRYDAGLIDTFPAEG